MVGALHPCTTTWVFRREPFFLPFYSPCTLTPSHPVTADCLSMLMISCFVILYWCSDQEGLDEDLHRLVTWSADHGLLINKTKCVECLFYPKNTSPQLPLSLINGEALSREQTVKYLGVHFNSNLTWSTHIDSVFTKCLKIFFLSEGSVQSK